MTWVIVIVVSLSLIGSWLMIRPSPRDRRLAQLRSRAIARGFHVEIASASDSAANALPQGTAGYWCAWPRGAAPETTYLASDLADLAGWPPHRTRAAKQLLSEMPVRVTMLRAGPKRLELVWAEDAAVAELDRALTLLEQVRSEFAGS